MSQVFITSDNHFGHDNMYKFLNYDGTKVRPQSSAAEGDAEMIEKWNALVQPQDKVYHLGDVAFSKPALAIMARLNGTKILLLGNHDKMPAREYLKYFKDVRSCKNLDRMLLTHYPVHPDSIGKARCNVHGHTHGQLVPVVNPEDRYINVCVEMTNYAPISLEELEAIARSRGW